MENMELKYLQVIFDKESPQALGSEVKIMGIAEENSNDLEYKFIVGRGGVWKTIREFSNENECIWKPKMEGKYIVMVQARDKNGKKPLDYLAKEDFAINNESGLEESKDNISCKENIIDINKEIQTNDDNEIKKEVALDKICKKEVSKKIISEVKIDKSNLVIGEKSTITVISSENEDVLYRFYVKRKDDWDIIRDYEADNVLKYTATQIGEKEFLIQCKRINSSDVFDDFTMVKINIKDMPKLIIKDFKCKNKELLVGEQLKFKVETNYRNEGVLYKFYKIYESGKSTCLQEYSNNNVVCYDETESGNYRILCLTKNILSNAEYDDRAILVYNVLKYNPIKIENFIADVNSPQAIGSNIKFTSEIKGGKKLRYRYIIKGVIEEDTGFIKDDEYVWTPKEQGKYEVALEVKDDSHKGECEDTSKLNFIIEKKGNKPLKIVDIIVDKDKNILVNQQVNIMVKCESEAYVEYCFKIRCDGEIVDKKNYNKSNWIDFIPKKVGNYEIEILAKDKYSKNEYDVHTFVYLNVLEYIPAKIDYIIMPFRETHLVGETISFECIVQNTQNILMKYETKINGYLIEKTDYINNKVLKFKPKVAGKYTIDVYAKNIKCKEEFDFKKQINIHVSEAMPVLNSKIEGNTKEFKVNEEASFEVFNKGGKDVCYEFYLMRNNNWEKVQSYSKKKYYSFIPFTKGKYRLLALVKSYYKKVNYEDYDIINFEVKDA